MILRVMVSCSTALMLASCGIKQKDDDKSSDAQARNNQSNTQPSNDASTQLVRCNRYHSPLLLNQRQAALVILIDRYAIQALEAFAVCHLTGG